jgi:hypothetical protein
LLLSVQVVVVGMVALVHHQDFFVHLHLQEVVEQVVLLVQVGLAYLLQVLHLRLAHRVVQLVVQELVVQV